MSKQNWDWLVILCEEKRPRYINGKEIPNWQQGPDLWEVVNYLGWKGWELVFSVFGHSPFWFGKGKLTFRRLKN
jgi:hypothetical protein